MLQKIEERLITISEEIVNGHKRWTHMDWSRTVCAIHQNVFVISGVSLSRYLASLLPFISDANPWKFENFLALLAFSLRNFGILSAWHPLIFFSCEEEELPGFLYFLDGFFSFFSVEIKFLSSIYANHTFYCFPFLLKIVKIRYL